VKYSSATVGRVRKEGEEHISGTGGRLLNCRTIFLRKASIIDIVRPK
jgi:hypothetical protein